MRCINLDDLSGVLFQNLDSTNPEASASAIVEKRNGMRVLVLDFLGIAAAQAVQILSFVDKSMSAQSGDHERHFAVLVVERPGVAFVYQSTIGSFRVRSKVEFKDPVIAS